MDVEYWFADTLLHNLHGPLSKRLHDLLRAIDEIGRVRGHPESCHWSGYYSLYLSILWVLRGLLVYRCANV